jgi:hypothetical protein
MQVSGARSTAWVVAGGARACARTELAGRPEAKVEGVHNKEVLKGERSTVIEVQGCGMGGGEGRGGTGGRRQDAGEGSDESRPSVPCVQSCLYRTPMAA